MKSLLFSAFLFSALLLRPFSATATPPTWDHIVVVIDENKAATQVIGNPVDAPYINSTLVAGGASMADMYGITHPSQPNYIQFFSGSNQGVFDNDDTSPITPFSTANLGAELVAAGKTFTGYAESMPSVGYTGFEADGGLYARRHNPWVNWQAANAPTANHLAPAQSQPFTSFPTNAAGFAALPSVSIVIPNNDNNMHDGTILEGDTWLQNNLGAYATWAQNNNSLLVLTFDEDNSMSRNRIPTVFYGANVQPGASVGGTWTLHNLLHTIEDSDSLTHAGASNNVRSIVGAFTGDPSVATTTFRQTPGGYSGAVDTYIESANPTTNRGTATLLSADSSPSTQALIRFDDLFGAAAGQVPVGATILSAKLSVLTGSSSSDESFNNMSIHRLTVPFTAASTWNSLTSGISLGTEANSTADFTLLPNTSLDYAVFDVTSSITSYAAAAAIGQNTNLGWVINPNGSDVWHMRSSDYSTVADRPILSITWSLPSISGDFDDDGDVDSADVDILWDIVRGTGTDPNNNDSADLDGSGLVNEDDVDLELASKLTAGLNRAYGDADIDGDVDGADFDQWRTRPGYTGAGTGTWATGDFDGDGDIDGADFDLWRIRPAAYPDNVGAHSAELTAVPEPASSLLMAVSLVLLSVHPLIHPARTRVKSL